MLDGLAYGLFAALVWGFTDICAALAARRLGGLATVAAVQATSFAGLCLFALLTADGSAFDLGVAPRAAALGIASAIAYISFFTGLGLGPIAVVSPVASAYGGLTVILAVVLLGERLTASQGLGAGLATLGILSVGLRAEGHWRSTRFVGPGVPLAIVSLVTWAFVTIGITILVRETSLVSVLLVARGANTLTVWILLWVRRWRRRWRHRGRSGAESPAGPPPARILALAILGGALDVAGYVVYATGLQRSRAWVVGLSSSFGPAIAILVAVIILGERLRRVQWFGLAMLAVGIVLIGLR